jgi:hypothetical protein
MKACCMLTVVCPDLLSSKLIRNSGWRVCIHLGCVTYVVQELWGLYSDYPHIAQLFIQYTRILLWKNIFQI